MIRPLSIYALYASSFTLAKILVAYVPPLLAIGTRFCLSGVLLASYTAYYNGKSSLYRIITSEYASLSKIAFINRCLAFGLAYVSMVSITSIEASLIFNLSPCVTALFAIFMFQRSFNTYKILGLICSVTALAPVFYVQLTGEDIQVYQHMPYVALCCIAMIADAYGWLMMQQIQETTAFGAIPLNGVSMLIAGCGLLVTSALIEPWRIISTEHLNYVALILLALSGIVDMIYINGYSYLLTHYSATFMSLLRVSIPLFTACLSSLLLNEKIPDGFSISLCLMTLGFSLFYVQERKD